MSDLDIARMHQDVLIGLNALALFQQGELGPTSAADCLRRSCDALETALAACQASQEQKEVVGHE